MQTQTQVYAAPWRERMPDGSLTDPYGPSASTYARRLADFKNWAWRAPEKKRAARERAERLVAWVEENRKQVPTRELEVYGWVYLRGMPVRWTARRLGVSRESVRTYLKRLRSRAAPLTPQKTVRG